MSDETSDILDALFRQGQLARDDWWAAYLGTLNRLAAELGNQRRFAADFGHLVPRPAPEPLHAMPPDQTAAHDGHVSDYAEPPRTAPPPLPQADREDWYDERLRVWEETFGRKPAGF